jgi:phosphatidylserine/phosphatidylglycerophosphate/cardiolipin synthase-like enzyme
LIPSLKRQLRRPKRLKYKQHRIYELGCRLPTVTFNFGTDVVISTVQEIERACEYVRIAIFQIHSNAVFNKLTEKLDCGVKVEIFTLPYDSINPDVRTEVESHLRELEKKGAILLFDKWNVGDPSRTTTAVGRWYSFHGKFIVTDKSAIALSANLTDSQELDASIVFRDDPAKIAEFNSKFDVLLRMFVTPDGTFDGTIRRQILVSNPDAITVFDLPKNIGEQHKNHWIAHYPVGICPAEVPIEEKLYITPFDCRGWNFFSKIIAEAQEYVYISTESFTDDSFSDFLVNTAVNNKRDIKVLTGATSMDFTDRIEDMFRDLLAQDIEVKTTVEELHAKLIVTDKVLVVSSMNLNKINLGFYQTLSFWRENTETIFVSKDPALIQLGKEKYLEIFGRSQNVNEILSVKLEGLVNEIFKGCFKLSPKPEVRKLFAKFILKKQIDTKKTIIKIGKITRKLMAGSGRTRVEQNDFLKALVLYHLSERKLDYTQIKERIEELGVFNVMQLLSDLTMAGKIEKDAEDYYKINVEALF